MKDLKFVVVGAGHGGKALAAHLAIKGFPVNLYNRTYSRILPIKKMRGIELEGEVKGFGRLNIVTDDIGKALKDTDIIMDTMRSLDIPLPVSSTVHQVFRMARGRGLGRRDAASVLQLIEEFAGL